MINLEEIAASANMIVNGYAFTKNVYKMVCQKSKFLLWK